MAVSSENALSRAVAVCGATVSAAALFLSAAVAALVP